MLAISIKDAMPSAVSCSLSEIVIPESASFTPATSASDVCFFACLLNLSLTYDLMLEKVLSASAPKR